MLRLTVAAGILAALPIAAQAQMPTHAVCVARDALADVLKDQHREEPVSLGLTEDGRAAELFASPDGKTWTFVLTTPTGIACVFATGEHWQQGHLVAGDWAS